MDSASAAGAGYCASQDWVIASPRLSKQLIADCGALGYSADFYFSCLSFVIQISSFTNDSFLGMHFRTDIAQRHIAIIFFTI